MKGGLPNGWTIIELRDHVYIAGRIGWRGLKAEEYTSSGPVLLSVPNLNHGDIVSFTNVNHISRARYNESPEIQLKIGDTLLVKDGAGIGKLGFVSHLPSDATVNSSLLVVRPNDNLFDPKYLFYYLKGPKLQEIALRRITGSATPHLFQKDIKTFQVLVPPSTEQQRIVEKLEKLLAEVEQCKERMAKIPVLLKHFRQSVLAACSGRLTADWRKDETYNNDLPAGWRYLRLEKLLPPGGLFDGPFGSNLKTSDYADSGVRVIRLENIGHLRFVSGKETYVSQEKYQSLRKHTVGEGDIMFASFIDEEVRVCVLPKLETSAIAKADCFCLRPKADLMDRRYLAYQLASRESYNALFKDVHGATRPRINTTQLRKLEIRVCPPAEQQEIVRRIDAMLLLADRIEAKYDESKRRIDGLTQSILAKAFRGELVPTEAELAVREDRSFESAEELLARIKRLDAVVEQRASTRFSGSGRKRQPRLTRKTRGAS